MNNNNKFDPFTKQLLITHEDKTDISDMLKKLQPPSTNIFQLKPNNKSSLPVQYENNVIYVDFKTKERICLD